jgi:hypothetical protein
LAPTTYAVFSSAVPWAVVRKKYRGEGTVEKGSSLKLKYAR